MHGECGLVAARAGGVGHRVTVDGYRFLFGGIKCSGSSGDGCTALHTLETPELYPLRG